MAAKRGDAYERKTSPRTCAVWWPGTKRLWRSEPRMSFARLAPTSAPGGCTFIVVTEERPLLVLRLSF